MLPLQSLQPSYGRTTTILWKNKNKIFTRCQKSMLFKQSLQPNLLQENVQNIIPCVHPLKSWDKK